MRNEVTSCDVRLWQTALLYEPLRKSSAAAPAAEPHWPLKQTCWLVGFSVGRGPIRPRRETTRAAPYAKVWSGAWLQSARQIEEHLSNNQCRTQKERERIKEQAVEVRLAPGAFTE